MAYSVGFFESRLLITSILGILSCSACLRAVQPVIIEPINIVIVDKSFNKLREVASNKVGLPPAAGTTFSTMILLPIEP